MRNHIHQFAKLSSRYSPLQLAKRGDRIWYRSLKKGMTDTWQEPVFSAWGVSWFKRLWMWFHKVAHITR